MRILFRNSDPGSGGGVSGVAQMMEAYCGRFPDDRLRIQCAGESPLAALGRFPNVEVEPLAGSRREIHRLAWAAHGIRRQLAHTACDLVWSMNVGPLVKTAVPQVLSIQNAYQVCPWRLARRHAGGRTRVAALRWFFRRSLGCADAAIVQTDLMKEYVQAIPGCPERVEVVPKAVVSTADDGGQPLSPALERTLRRASAAGAFTALYAATYGPHKNHRLLAEAMEICRRSAVPVRLVVTLTAAEWAAAAGAAAEGLVRSGHAIAAGWVPKDQLRALYAGVDCCVMPSLLESLSSAHLEAMEWRRPQIAADLPYAREVCGDAALYADPADAPEWVGQLERLRDDRGLRERLVSRGAARLAGFPATWSAMAERLRWVFLAVVKNKRRATAWAAEEAPLAASSLAAKE